MARWRAFSVASVLVVAATACGSDGGAGGEAGAASTSSPTTTVAAPFAPPTGTGPWAVGRTTITTSSADGTGSREIDVWYPAAADVEGTPSVYRLPEFPTLSTPSELALDGVPVADGGPFPLVVYSHGSGGLRFIASFFTEALASHGFVVAAPDHEGDTIVDIVEGTSTANDQGPTIQRRVLDVSTTIDAVVARTADDGDLLAGAVDPERIGVAGHSYGGLTAIAAVAGLPDWEPATITTDPRIDVLVTMDPSVGALDSPTLADVDVPMLTITGDVDPDPAGYRVQHHATGELLDVRLPTAAHLQFTDICRYQELIPTQADPDPLVAAYVDGLADGNCHPPHMPSARVQELTNRYAVAWLLVHLTGDERAEPFLAPDEAPDVLVVRPEHLDPEAPPPTYALPPPYVPPPVTD